MIFFFLICIVVVLWRQRLTKTKKEKHTQESDNGDYDEIYANQNEQVESEIVQNPYYGDEVNINGITPEKKTWNERNMQIVTARSNIYYET